MNNLHQNRNSFDFCEPMKNIRIHHLTKIPVQKNEHKENITAGLFRGNYEDLQQQVNGFHSRMVNQSHPSYLDFLS